jgi:hypothetical protein
MEYSDDEGSVRATGIKLLRCAWEDGLKMGETFARGYSSGEFCLLLLLIFQFGNFSVLAGVM